MTDKPMTFIPMPPEHVRDFLVGASNLLNDYCRDAMRNEEWATASDASYARDWIGELIGLIYTEPKNILEPVSEVINSEMVPYVVTSTPIGLFVT